MEAWDFCRRWFNATEEQQQARGYKARCNELLVKVLGVNIDAVKRWGSHFEKMPDYHKRTLSYADTLREVIEATGKHEEFLVEVLQRIEKAR
jgi:hypothetical protein